MKIIYIIENCASKALNPDGIDGLALFVEGVVMSGRVLIELAASLAGAGLSRAGPGCRGC